MKKNSMAMSTPVMIRPFGGSKHMSYGTIIVQNMTAKSEVLSGGQRTGANHAKSGVVRKRMHTGSEAAGSTAKTPLVSGKQLCPGD